MVFVVALVVLVVVFWGWQVELVVVLMIVVVCSVVGCQGEGGSGCGDGNAANSSDNGGSDCVNPRIKMLFFSTIRASWMDYLHFQAVAV